MGVKWDFTAIFLILIVAIPSNMGQGSESSVDSNVVNSEEEEEVIEIESVFDPPPRPNIPCKSGETFDNRIGRCRLAIDTDTVPASIITGPNRQCSDGQVYDPRTDSCRESAEEKAGRQKQGIIITAPDRQCPDGQVNDPRTKTCREKLEEAEEVIGIEMVNKVVVDSPSRDSKSLKCPNGEVWNERSGSCRKIVGGVGSNGGEL
ncbi:uncharacterized protein LOC132202740 isoform X2 [Neocloeon triangulifer]|uniref:uncharacterized protein LOC132202740 isoform X2 n=1 Tax=Neocloeon triangulifer TaxID=2078957 RepID=UPI00286F405C|nr:uncharacterized protein LOC132202740 isoform X2 [Neocloeon triangulifer]